MINISKKRLLFYPILLLTKIFFLTACDYEAKINTDIPMDSTLFDTAITKGLIENDELNEASGLVVSRQNANFLWSHNDSGDKARLFVMDKTGTHVAEFVLIGVKARDWEDIAMYYDSTTKKNYVFLADIGDNEAVHDTNYIYRFEEPNILTSKKPIPIKKIDVIKYSYPEKQRDAETLIIDPTNGDIVIISKREDNVFLYITPQPKDFSKFITLKKIGTLPFHNIVAGDISPDGKEILIKDYDNIYYWKNESNQSIKEVLMFPATRLPYESEPQGEAIAWDPKGKGFYTLSEERKQIPAKLYFYSRKK